MEALKELGIFRGVILQLLMVSQKEGHTSGVRDLFFQTHLSNCRAAAGGSEFPFCERLFSKVLPGTHANRCHIFPGHFSRLACFFLVLNEKKKMQNK